MMTDNELKRLAHLIVIEQAQNEDWMLAFAKAQSKLQKTEKRLISSKKAALLPTRPFSIVISEVVSRSICTSSSLTVTATSLNLWLWVLSRALATLSIAVSFAIVR